MVFYLRSYVKTGLRWSTQGLRDPFRSEGLSILSKAPLRTESVSPRLNRAPTRLLVGEVVGQEELLLKLLPVTKILCTLLVEMRPVQRNYVHNIFNVDVFLKMVQEKMLNG